MGNAPFKTDTFLKGRIGWNGLRADEFKETSFAYLVTGQDFKGPDICWKECYQIDKERYDEDPFIQLNNGDLLITKDGTIGKIAKVTNMDKPACLNSGVFVMKQKNGTYIQGYLYWMLCSNMFYEFNSYTSTGTTILHLYQNVFERMPLLVPPLPEQRAIAAYLDRETSRIDARMAKHRKQVELLKECKTTLISNVVTGKIKVTE
jgi:type I restriction enzyme S subunit